MAVLILVRTVSQRGFLSFVGSFVMHGDTPATLPSSPPRGSGRAEIPTTLSSPALEALASAFAAVSMGDRSVRITFDFGSFDNARPLGADVPSGPAQAALAPAPATVPIGSLVANGRPQRVFASVAPDALLPKGACPFVLRPNTHPGQVRSKYAVLNECVTSRLSLEEFPTSI
jgi:hypothetical protein